MNEWYIACEKAASVINNSIPETYRSRTFSGIIGDIKALSPEKAISLVSRKKGLGKQYAHLYLTHGIDSGKGYQACATVALSSILGKNLHNIIKGQILDVGCAVGVTAGLLSLENVIGFDLFTDLLHTAKIIDSFTNKRNHYLAADMTKTLPFKKDSFDTVICGLVCHHLKIQSDITGFFSNINRVLKTAGSLVITLPSGSISKTTNLIDIENSLEIFGFKLNRELSGLVLSNDGMNSLFWMFLIIGEKISDNVGKVFINPEFEFPKYRTPVSREEKSKRAKKTLNKTRKVKHEIFKLINIRDLENKYFNSIYIYDTMALIQNTINTD